MTKKTKNKIDKIIKKLKTYLNRHSNQFLKDPNITSCGIGYKESNGNKTDEVCIQFTVKKKISFPEGSDTAQVEALGIHSRRILSTLTLDDGTQVTTDVLERDYEPNYKTLEKYQRKSAPEPIPEHHRRRIYNEELISGISVSHFRGTAGTMGAIVYDRKDGTPYILSNWHVLHGEGGEVGDPILQPGPYDGGLVDQDRCGTLVRSHLGLAGDCAISTIEDRDFSEEILGLGTYPESVAVPDLGDKVIKSGRTTNVTRGIVTRINVVTKLNYGPETGVRNIGAFEIEPNPEYPPERGEISSGGDSGSLWLIDDPDSMAEGGVVVGLHFAGESDPRPEAEHAVACYMDKVLDKLDVSLIDPFEETLDDDELLAELAKDVHALKADVLLLIQRLNELEGEELGGSYKDGGTITCDCHKKGSSNLGKQGSIEGVRVYGNWCGPGHGGGPTIDAVDAVCKRHDHCYSRKGYLNCDCDSQLVREMGTAITRPGVSAKGRLAGTAALTYFSIAPCIRYARIGGKNIPYLPGAGGLGSSTVSSGIKAVKRGAKKVWKKVSGWF